MTAQVPYSYTVLRYVHDVVAGESLNVGVVMYSANRGILKVKTRKSIGRLRQAFPDIDLQGFRYEMNAIEREFSELAAEVATLPLVHDGRDARTTALSVLPEDDSSLQWSPVGSGLTENLDRTFDQLYFRYVSKYDIVSAPRRTDKDIWRPVRIKLAERGADVQFQEKVVSGSLDSIKFKSAWKNGDWHAYQAVSLDLADETGIKNKARRWRGHLSAVKEGSTEEVRLHFLVGPPRDESLWPAYNDAKSMLEGAAFTQEVVDERDADSLVDSIEREYRSATA